MRSLRVAGLVLGLTTHTLVAAAPAALVAQSQGGTLTGRVVDEGTGEPLAGARVFVIGTARASTVRQDGAYRLQLAEGRHEIRVTYIGYGLARDTVEVAAGETVTRDFRLTREPLALEELAVVGTRAAERTSTEAAVPVDVLTAADVAPFGFNGAFYYGRVSYRF